MHYSVQIHSFSIMLGMMRTRGSGRQLGTFVRRQHVPNIGVFHNKPKHVQTRSTDNRDQLHKNVGGAGGVKRKYNNSSKVENKRQKKPSPKFKGPKVSKSTSGGKHIKKPVVQKKASSKQVSHRQMKDVI